MKIKGSILLYLTAVIMLVSCSKGNLKNVKVESRLDSLSYAYGIYIHAGLSKDSVNLDPMILAKAMMDSKNGKPAMDENVARGFLFAYFNERDMVKKAKQAEANKILYKDLIAKSDSFLQKNKERQGVIVTASGLQYEVIKMGTGPKPTPNSEVKVQYKGSLIDGTQFDASDPKKPVQFLVKGVIKGWTEALQLMPVGSKFKLYIPQELAYGAEGAGGVIKPFSTLIFEVELLEITK
jgi:FKBP-type peptidyl-prolyl cis-trans isomerase FklB